MTHDHQEQPTLYFFRDWPANLINRPPLASSLQHLETSFLLIAMYRYPHALVSCGSAIESAIKAAINATPNDRLDFKELIEKAEQKFPLFTTINKTDIKSFRSKRNEIIHYGFSPKDDGISAIHLLRTGYDLLEDCYKSFFQFSLSGDNNSMGGLNPDFSHHLRIARAAYHKYKESKELDFTNCFISFARKVQCYMRPTFMTKWENNKLYADVIIDNGESWDFNEKQIEKISRTMDIPWRFNCPVCDEIDSFVCDLDDDQLDLGKVSLKKGTCGNCSLSISSNFSFLVDELCKDQFDREKPKIFKDLGIK